MFSEPRDLVSRCISWILPAGLVLGALVFSVCARQDAQYRADHTPPKQVSAWETRAKRNVPYPYDMVCFAPDVTRTVMVEVTCTADDFLRMEQSKREREARQ